MTALGVLAAAFVLAGAATDVAELSWMAGVWAQDRNGDLVQETWLQPRDGMMAGVSQTNRPGRRPFVEHMTISVEARGVTFTAYIPGQAPTAFVRIPSGAGSAIFENPAHDFPQRIFYRRCGDALCAGIEGVVDGASRREEWRYTRVR